MPSSIGAGDGDTARRRRGRPAYLLATHDLIAAAAPPSTPEAFSATVLLVGGVNVFRGFWTLLSHVIEGRGYPNVSFKTKVYGLVAGVPVTVALGGEFGAVAGPAGYVAMNLVVCAYVVVAAHRLLGSSVLDGSLAIACALELLRPSGRPPSRRWRAGSEPRRCSPRSSRSRCRSPFFWGPSGCPPAAPGLPLRTPTHVSLDASETGPTYREPTVDAGSRHGRRHQHLAVSAHRLMYE